MLKEFKEFILKGNALDMAVGLIIGAAFGTVVKSLVADILMPPLGLLMGNVDFSNLFAVIKEGSKAAAPYVSLGAAKEAGAVTINYGLFINNIISLLIVGFAVFILVKNINRFKKEEVEEATTKDCPYCCSEIALDAIRCPNCTSDLNK